MKLTKELFHDVVAFVFSEPGAMGCAGTIRFLRANGQSFFIDYLEGNTWSLLKETFSGVKEAVFNGPNPLTPYVANVFALGGSPDDPKPKNAEGWHEIAFDCGNHMSVRREYARGFINLFAGKEPTEIILDGFDIIRKEKALGRLEEFADAYHKQELWDQEFTKRLAKWHASADYQEKVAKANGEGGMERVLQMLKEEYGFEVTAFEIKQYAFRKMGYL